MTSRNNQTKLTIYRRHAGSCSHKEDSRVLDQCECPLWLHGKLHGKFIRRSLDTRSLISALERQRNLLRQSPAGGGPTGPQLVGKPAEVKTLESAIQKFIEAKKKLSTSSVSIYTRAATDFLEWAHSKGILMLSEITYEHVDAYLDSKKKWKRNSVQGRLSILRVFFNFCMAERHKWILTSPANDSTLNRKTDTMAARKPFAPEEVTRILAAVESDDFPAADRDRARALVYLLLYTGMRISDATFFERAFLVNNVADYYIIKTRKLITIPPEIQKPALDALAKLPPSRVYFFQPDRDDDYQEARQALREELEFGKHMPDYDARIRETTALVIKVLRLAKLTGACHRFRDTFAVTMLCSDENPDIYTVSKMLGHSDIKMTEDHYLKLVGDYRTRMSHNTRKLAYQFPAAS